MSRARDDRGRFVHWEFVKNLVGTGRAVSVYGHCRTTFGEYPARYDFEYGEPRTGSVRELKEAIALGLHLPPKRRRITVGSLEFLENPFVYGTRGYWVERPDIDS